MNINEIFDMGDSVEKGFIDSDIIKRLQKLNYKPLGSGKQQDAFLAPDGTVLKIFSTSKYTNNMTDEQRKFIKFYQYCKAHPNNPFLPKFIDYSKFKYGDRVYLQIKMERLFPLPPSIKMSWTSALMELEHHISVDNGTKKEFLRKEADEQSTIDLLNYLGKEQFDLLFKTLVDLTRWSRSNLGASYLDVGPDNWMFRSEGQLVLLDPFYFGTLS